MEEILDWDQTPSDVHIERITFPCHNFEPLRGGLLLLPRFYVRYILFQWLLWKWDAIELKCRPSLLYINDSIRPACCLVWYSFSWKFASFIKTSQKLAMSMSEGGCSRECIRRDLFPPFSEQKPSKVIASIKSKYLKCLPRFITLSHPDLPPAPATFLCYKYLFLICLRFRERDESERTSFLSD